MTNGEKVTAWAINHVKKHYAEDIDLIISHSTLRINKDEKTVSYFVPATEKGFLFGQTFLLDNEGFDIWGIGWERLEGFANLEEYNLTCLADGEILYAKSQQAVKRFEALQKKLADNLRSDETCRKLALTAYTQAKQIYLEAVFAQDSDVKLGAGYVLDYLAQSIAFTNHRYYKSAQIAQLEELRTMENVPDGFSEKYLKTIREKSGEKQKKLCYELIMLTKAFLTENGFFSAETVTEKNFQDLADWYAELSYTWLRIRHYTAQNDPVKAYMWGIFLQEELNRVCEDYGLEKQQLMMAYNYDDLPAFAAQSQRIEAWIKNIICSSGGRIRAFDSIGALENEV
ncbi:MAG: hypothetical protein QM689_09415 [Oscillospiraceae bacterium]